MTATTVRLLLTASLLGFAWSSLPTATAQERAAGPMVDGYIPGIADTLSVTVFGRPDLSGPFVIGQDGTIRHPLVGEVHAAGRPRHDIEVDLKRALLRLIDYEPPVTVDIAAYRPVFVIGDVTNPGEIAFSPGMSVLTAFAKAGGMISVREQSATPWIDAAAVERDLRTAQTDLHALLIRRAALEAALAGAPSITLPPELESSFNQGAVAEMIARENTILVEEQARLEQAQTMADRQRDELAVEIEALETERSALAEQVEPIEAELKNMETLQKKGLTTNSRVIELLQLKAGIEADRQRLTAAMSRARQEQLQIEQRRQERRDELKMTRLREHVTLTADIERARTRVEAFQASSLSRAPVADLASGRPVASFSVTRAGSDGPVIVAATGNTLLHPGDIVEVSIAPAGNSNQIGMLQPGSRPTETTGTGR